VVEATSETSVGKDGPSRFQLRVDAHLSDRLESHLQFLKTMRKRGQTKGDWVAEAISEKLHREEQSPLQHPTSRRLAVPLDTELASKLEDKMEMFRRMGVTVTKNRWVLEAMLEKLELEERELSSWKEQLRAQISACDER